MIEKLKMFFARFAQATNGVAAIEFALIAPVMITLFFASVEVSNILIVDRKVTTTSSAIADLVAQDMELTDSEMADIFAVAASLFEPFPVAGLSLTVSSIIDDNGDPKVDWSDSYQGGADLGVGPDSLPTGILTTGASIIVVEARYLHSTGVGHFLADEIIMEDVFYARPRRTPVIERTN